MFKLPDEIKKDLENYRQSLQDLLANKISASRFKGVRVPWGTYSHRGGKVYMARIRVPAGLITAGQLKALAAASRKYGDGVLHVTTRQDIQIHNVKLEDILNVADDLYQYQLSPRGGGGNTLRNVIACPLAGICCDELFDVRSHAIGLTEQMMRRENSFNLPRKFKIAFSGCAGDCAGIMVQDVGFLACDSNGKKGFKVFAGGGMGADSRLGKALEEFVPEADLGYTVEAIKNVFYKHGDRRDRHHNRLRFLVDNLGIDAFKQLYEKELRGLKENEHIALRTIDFPAPAGKEVAAGIPRVQEKDFLEFLKYSVIPQRQTGFAAVEIRLPQGDITAGDLTALAGLEKDFPGIEFRTSQDQNIYIAWVDNADVYKLFIKLKTVFPDFLYAGTLLDIVACKGALTCNLGLCNSPALSRAMEPMVKSDFIGKNVFTKLNIKLNGCPNSCGQQPLGKLSFYGMVRRVDNRPVPFYKFLIGGRRAAENTRFAQEAGVIPAKSIPEFLREFLTRAEAEIEDGKDIYNFLDNAAGDIAREILPKYTFVPPYCENRDFYIDWERNEEFSLAGIGPGECGAGVLDIIEADLTEAKLALEAAEKESFNPEKIKTALYLSARALLVVKGEEPRTPEAAFSYFKQSFIAEGIAAAEYSRLKAVFDEITDGLGAEQRQEKFAYARKFLEHINNLYKIMDSAFNFPKPEAVKPQEAAVVRVLDLKGTPCPINYVKAKLALENLNSGDNMEIILDEGEPIQNVPKSLTNDGHKVLNIEKQGEVYRVLVKKK